MIPLKLSLKNFVSYGPLQEIDFEPYNLMCLAGKNGHGKSALLDALTWVLWGQARKVGGAVKPDDGLMRLGQTHMMVSLDFTCNNILYRVRREYTITSNKSHATLEFGILDPATNAVRALTDKTIRATQAKIVNIISLDYESFINSAFLRQGQSHEFSKKSPKDRKEILATILGLDQFEKMRRRALDKAREAINEKGQHIAVMHRFEQELQTLPVQEERLKKIGEALQQLATKEEQILTSYENIKVKMQEAAAQKAHSEKIVFQKQHLEKSVEEQRQQILEQATTWRRIARLQRNKQSFPQLEAERTALHNELQTLQIQATKTIQLKEEYLVKKEQLHTFIRQLQEQHKQAENQAHLTEQALTIQLNTTQAKLQEGTKKRELIDKELAAIATEKATLEKKGAGPTEASIKAAENTLERYKRYYHTFLSRAQALTTRLESIHQKRQLIDHTEETRCPLCEQVADKDALHAKFEAEHKRYAHQAQRLAQVIKNLKIRLTEENGVVEHLKKCDEQARIAQLRIAELEKQKVKLLPEREQIETEHTTLSSHLTELHQKKEAVKQEIEKITASIHAAAEHETYKKIQNELTFMEQALKKIPSTQIEEKVIQEKLGAVTQKLAEQATSIQEEARQEERKRVVHQKCAYVREVKTQITFLATTLTQFNSSAEQEAAISTEEKKIREELHKLTKEKEQLIHQKGALESQCTALKQLEGESKRVQETVKTLLKQEEEYTAIALALSKDGIQALLIEDALPEIEHEANSLLSKLTDNQAHISIESLRDLRSGKTKETLDIKISDAVGVRPYELFSGGEAFRIDFALRIAISKLLARRAGTALPTLIIDEGFGSQDEEGLSNIMEALYTIQEDFEKIIIVSHLPGLKEQFPVHFNVTKTADGSIVNIIEHC